jgi:hypothetical protein
MALFSSYNCTRHKTVACFWQLKRTQMNLVQYFCHSETQKRKSDDFKALKNSCKLENARKLYAFSSKKISRSFFCPLVPPSWIVQNVTPRELSRRSIPPISMVTIFIKLLEIHACNNPSPVFKRCLLSAVASTSSQGVCEVR